MANCYDCGLAYDDPGFADLVVPNDVWLKISPTGNEGGLLCPTCLVRACEKAGIDQVPATFRSGPFRDYDRDDEIERRGKLLGAVASNMDGIAMAEFFEDRFHPNLLAMLQEFEDHFDKEWVLSVIRPVLTKDSAQSECERLGYHVCGPQPEKGNP